jgi:transcriptional regulator
MGKPNSKRVINERREKILELMAKGYSQFEITKQLGVTRQTISSDMTWINQQTQKGLFGIAKETLSTMFFNCIDGVNAVQRECWKIYRNEDNNPEIQQWHRMSALKLIMKCNESKFNMYTNGPAFMELHRLQGEVHRLKDNTFDEKGNLKRELTDNELDDFGIGKP